MPDETNTCPREEFAAEHLRDRHGRPWVVRDYQRDSLNSSAPRKLHCDGRDVGKTTEIEITALWFLFHQPGLEMLIATQTENHLDPLMQRIARRIAATPEFRARLVESRRSPSWFFRFDTGAILWGRIAGPRGINFQGMHVDFQIVDEAQEMTDTAWGELYQALNGGGLRWVYGVPNGLRNTFYRMSQQTDIEQHHWESSVNPEFSPEKDAELIQLYGGKDSPGYTHRVLGRHGAPAHAVFNLDDYLHCIDDTLDFIHLHAHGNTPLKSIPLSSSHSVTHINPAASRSQISFGNALVPQAPLGSSSSSSSSSSESSVVNSPLPLPKQATSDKRLATPPLSRLSNNQQRTTNNLPTFLGCDLGFARDPSEFVIYQSAPPHLINIARIHLTHVNYARQAQLIQDLDAEYHFDGIGIDAGNNGRAVAHMLMQLGPDWCDKIHAYEFGGTTELAELPDGTKPKRRTKELMTELLVQRLTEHTIIFPRLPDRESQYASHTYEVGQHGNIVYQKGNDHIIDADRCALLRHHLHTSADATPFNPYLNRSPVIMTF